MGAVKSLFQGELKEKRKQAIYILFEKLQQELSNICICRCLVDCSDELTLERVAEVDRVGA